MQYRRLGKSGLHVSALSVGTWQTVNHAADTTLITQAFERGVNFFDTADGYANGNAEILLGKALKSLPRSDYVVSTKCFFPQSPLPTNRGLSRKHIVESVQQSLKRLQMEHIDILICHRFDEHTPLIETVSAMENLIRQGKILYWGVSRWSVTQLQEVMRIASPAYQPIMVQSVYNMLNRRELPVIEWCRQHDVGFVAYSPLAQGVLTGKYVKGIPAESRAADKTAHAGMYDYTEENISLAKHYAEFAGTLAVPPSALAIGYCLHTPGITSVVCGIKSVTQLNENIAGTELTLSADILGKLSRPEAAHA